MKAYNNLLFSSNAGIGVLTLHRPHALNALNYDLLKELDDVLTHIEEDETTKVVIITGSGDRAFAAGADITEMQPLSAMAGRSWARFGQAVFNKIENLPQPVIAAVNGFALGGGCELAMACDIRLAADNARFGQPEVTLGIVPGFAGTQRLPRLVGKGRAKELLFTGDIIDAREAYRIGLVNSVTAPAELMNTARALAEKIMSRAAAAVMLCKTAVNKGLDMDLSSGVDYEAEVFGLCFATADQKEGMTAFVEKRKAHFTGQ
jgi:enoyl-CoA hydratase